MEETVESWLNVEFNHAKYTKDLWGRSVIQAIDMDNCFELYNCMHQAGEKINTQMTILGYDQYLWTSSVHKFLGDTALHFAVRQKKMMCVHMLLILKAKTDIPNAVGITAESLSVALFGTNIKNLEFEAYKFILNRINLKDIGKLPDSFRYRHIEKEAWKLMEDGRILYSELPTSFAGDDTILNKHLYNVRKNYLSFNVKKPGSAVAAEVATEAVPASGAATTSTSAAVAASSATAPEAVETPPLSSSVSSSRAASASAKSRPTDKKSTNSSSAESSATSSRVGSPQPSPTRPGKAGADTAKSSAKAPTSKDAKSAKGAQAKGKAGSDSESASSKPGTKGKSSKDAKSTKSTKSTKSKASTLSGNYDSDSSADSSQASSVGSLLKIKSKKTADKDKGKGTKSGVTKGIKNSKQSDEEEVAAKEVIPPRPRTLREQYEDSGTKMTQRAELEVLREDIKQQTEHLRGLTDQSKVTPGVSVPPLPQDFAVTLIEQERKLRSLQRELHEKSQLYYASINTPKSISPGKRGANKEGIGKAVGLQSNAADLEGGRRASAKVKTGVAAAPAAALATGDVWGRDNLCDVIYLIERQKSLHFERMLASRQPVAKGLKLLDSVKISNSVERVIAHERDLQVGKGDSLYIPEELYEMQGVKKLKFMNLNKLRSLAQSTTVQQANSKTGASGRLAKSISDKILFQQDSAAAGSLESSSLDGASFGGGASRISSHTQRRYMVPEVPEYETMRQITKFSTHSNMKYMKIGDEGAEQLGIALQNDEVVTELCLAGARIFCVGASLFAKYLPDIKALRYLDLSNNAISDKGAVALAAALPFCVLLEQLNLMGNRIASVGAVRLILAVFSAPLHWLSLKNNLIVNEEMQIVLKVLEESNYSSEHCDGIFEPNSTPSIAFKRNGHSIASTTTLDQLRWQQIRQTEALQLVESENIALKKEIQELKSIKPVAVVVADPNAGADKKLIQKFALNMRNILMRTQSELLKLKLTSVQEINHLMNHKNLLSKAFDNLNSAYRVKEAEMEALEINRDQLQEQLDHANQNLQEGANFQASEVNRLKTKYKQARTEQKETQSELERQVEALRTLQEKYNSLHGSKVELQSNYEGLNKEYLGMQALLDKARADGEAALAESFNNKLAMQEQYEKIVEELSYENEYLRNTCADQEGQIERLTNSLIGNKSHFARYVEVKTENLTLQSKLQAVTKGSAKFSGIPTGTGSNKAAAGTTDFSQGQGQVGALPAHNKRPKGVLASAGAAAVANGGNSQNSTGWGSSASGSIRVPSPRAELPDYGNGSQARVHPGSGLSTSTSATAGLRMPQRPSPAADQHVMLSDAHGGGYNAQGERILLAGAAQQQQQQQGHTVQGDGPGGVKNVPQTSPRYGAPHRQGSSNSVHSMLNEPTILPPPVKVIKPLDAQGGPSVGGESSMESHNDGSGKSKKSIRFEAPVTATASAIPNINSQNVSGSGRVSRTVV